MASGPSPCFHWEQPSRMDRTRRSRRTRSSRSASAGARPSGSPDDQIRALVLPPLPYGVTRYGAAFPGAVSIGEETLARSSSRSRSLAAQGLGRIVLVNSHFEPEQVRTLRETVAELGPTARLLDLTRRGAPSG